MSDSDPMSDVEEEKEMKNCSTPQVLEKYKQAGIIANLALSNLLKKCKAGMRIVELCEWSDNFIKNETEKSYKKGSMEKGIAFPTCISVNEVAGHFSPWSTDQTILQQGDLVKIDLGVQFDGFASVVAHTITLGKCEGRKADVIAAAWTAAQAAIRLIKVGEKNTSITSMISKSASTFKCEALEGVLSHEILQHVLDGDQCIINKETPENKVEEIEFEPYKVFGVDICCSTGTGKPADRENLCTVYKRNVDINYQLKLKASRQLLGIVNKKFPTFPFTLRALENVKIDSAGTSINPKMGIRECEQHELLHPYPVLSEKKGEFIAQFKFTVVTLPTGTLQITGLPVDQTQINTEFKVEDAELQKILSQPLKSKKKRKRKKKAKQTPTENSMAD